MNEVKVTIQHAMNEVKVTIRRAMNGAYSVDATEGEALLTAALLTLRPGETYTLSFRSPLSFRSSEPGPTP